MKILLVMRHATAGEKKIQQTDFDKELTMVGERQAGQAGLWLKAQSLVPDLILVSSAERTMATCLHLVEAIGKEVPVQQEKSIYSGSEKDLFYLVQDVADEKDTVLLIGHNPTISFFVSQILHQEVSFNQADLAVVHLPIASWAEIKTAIGKLSAFYKT